jgi:type IV pilus assembly protein PilA
VKDAEGEPGLTLVELLIVILIIAVLAAIAIPVFLRQREKSYVAQTQSTLKSAATAAETYATENEGTFAGLDGDNGALLRSRGFKPSGGVTIAVASGVGEYCIAATHPKLDGAHMWRISTYNSADDSPSPADVDACQKPRTLVAVLLICLKTVRLVICTVS